MRYAFIVKGVVQAVLPADKFVPEPAGLWVQTDRQDVAPGWTYDGAAFHAPAESE